MMRVTYTGPLDAVEIADMPGVIIENGKGVDVPDDLGERLIQQDVWRGPKTKTDDKPTKTDDKPRS